MPETGIFTNQIKRFGDMLRSTFMNQLQLKAWFDYAMIIADFRYNTSWLKIKGLAAWKTHRAQTSRLDDVSLSQQLA